METDYGNLRAMNQDNATRLKEEFRFAAKGARCRTATFINPNFAALGQRDWMEAECANGKSWDIKIMKFSPPENLNENPDEGGVIEQAYLNAHRDISFGSAILKLTEYQQGQKALGFLPDAADTGQIAGAPLFTPMAEKVGIAFDVDGNPVAPVKGLITVSGRYPASAFNKVQSALADLARPVSTALAPVHVEISIDEALRRKKIVGILTTLVAEMKEMKGDPLGSIIVIDLGLFFIRGTKYQSFKGTKYQSFAKKFDESYANIQKITGPQSPYRQDDFMRYLKQKLDLFEFHTFQIAAASIIDRGTWNTSLKDSIRRCEVAWEKVNPGTEMPREKVFSPSQIGITVLEDLVAEISGVIEGKPVVAPARDRNLFAFNP
ncbi:MAG: hypothetical protein ACXW30_07060 [Micavibrio sp.]